MTAITREFLLRKPFNDFRNYPYGFSRSGDFSIRESDALTQYGCLITALLQDELKPSCDEDISLLASARGEQAPVTVVEKAWAKYQARIHRPKVASMYGKGKLSDEDFGYSTDSEDDLIVED
ncbi:hypothetical protein DFP83_106119 [Idiomarina fontislapidosi]|uniref:Macrodomain Ori protein n=1 Tax=Idiomarina fontislapidosi TaxID=263723 RepID=A0A432Y7Y6_9GAMM|nr:DUF413 domain-containing protein [Idiomarina fontislapidosi]PYE32392.1 hypothetical protein DFP83_106119 [Idiomarina fontislapidosi]RUO57095.1 hypothetical protein CWE25_05320 [Idiomarina fontislapidosi]